MKPSQGYKTFELQGIKGVSYYPEINLFTAEEFNKDKIDRSVTRILFLFFLGIRKLVALRKSLSPPRTIVLDPYRMCNLSCKYCYSRSGPEFNKKADYEIIKKVISRYNIKEIMVFGGEPLIDKPFLKRIFTEFEWDDYFFSTNGILIDEDFVNDFVNENNVKVQLSMEPSKWKQRVNTAGSSQFDLIKPKFNAISKVNNLHLRVTIPSEVPYIPLREFVDCLTSSIGNDKFSIFYWPVRGKGLPDWLDKWILESVEMLRENPMKYANKILSEEIYTVFLKEMNVFGFRLYNCTAGYESVAVGPDSKLHACHEAGSVESKDDMISSDHGSSLIDEGRKLNKVYEWSNNMSNLECQNCPAKYICGGVCFLENNKPESTCEFIRKTIGLALTQYAVRDPPSLENLVKLSKERFEKLYCMKDELTKEVESKEWMQLVSGELPVARATALAKKL